MCVLRFASVWLLVAGSVLVPASAGRAQPRASEGGIAGVVLDPSGGRVEGAQVSVLAADGALCARARTSDGGRFAVGVVPGRYRLEVIKHAFETASATVQVVEGAPSEVVTITLRRIDGSLEVFHAPRRATTTAEGDGDD